MSQVARKRWRERMMARKHGLRLVAPAPQTPPPKTPNPNKALALRLMEMGALSSKDMAGVRAEHARLPYRSYADLLLQTGRVSELALRQAQAVELGLGLADISHVYHCLELVHLLPRKLAQQTSSVPWARAGTVITVATAAPEHRQEISAVLAEAGYATVFALAPRDVISDRILAAHGPAMRARAEALPPPHLSCRDNTGLPRILISLAVLLCTATLLAPRASLIGLCTLALIALLISTILKVAFLVTRARPMQVTPPPVKTLCKPPLISLFLPLFKEETIASTLVMRLAALRYPRALLEICLIVEESDWDTRRVLAQTALPAWFRVIIVPDGQPRTKPRAMNYALAAARGEIIGIYDAEDAPDLDQLEKVATYFATAPPDVACVQGALDFYNAGRNWISTCFAIEYATWFRVILPGLAKLGHPIPLGGTTLFFRKDALEGIGGWDAHNVTEDADLGIRLTRAGFRTVLIDTTTQEEANSAVWPWIKQRSRWLKGYVMTYAVHCRDPTRLWCDLGLWGMLGVHIHFGVGLLTIATTPLLLSLGISLFGFDHAFFSAVGPGVGRASKLLLITAFGVSIITAAIGCHRAGHPRLWPWIPLSLAYHAFAPIALLKACIEVVRVPYYWDKTDHGGFGGTSGE